MTRTFRITREANDTLALHALIEGNVYQGPEEVDEDGLFTIELSPDIVEWLENLYPTYDLDSPSDLSEVILMISAKMLEES